MFPFLEHTNGRHPICVRLHLTSANRYESYMKRYQSYMRLTSVYDSYLCADVTHIDMTYICAHASYVCAHIRVIHVTVTPVMSV